MYHVTVRWGWAVLLIPQGDCRTCWAMESLSYYQQLQKLLEWYMSIIIRWALAPSHLAYYMLCHMLYILGKSSSLLLGLSSLEPHWFGLSGSQHSDIEKNTQTNLNKKSDKIWKRPIPYSVLLQKMLNHPTISNLWKRRESHTHVLDKTLLFLHFRLLNLMFNHVSLKTLFHSFTHLQQAHLWMKEEVMSWTSSGG